MAQVIGVLRGCQSITCSAAPRTDVFWEILLHDSPNLVLHSQSFRVFPNLSLFLIGTKQRAHAPTG